MIIFALYLASLNVGFFPGFQPLPSPKPIDNIITPLPNTQHTNEIDPIFTA